jgi:hypothetical protein
MYDSILDCSPDPRICILLHMCVAVVKIIKTPVILGDHPACGNDPAMKQS